jgi:hypothetical protein
MHHPNLLHLVFATALVDADGVDPEAARREASAQASQEGGNIGSH